jgi:hypothetical protein
MTCSWRSWPLLTLSSFTAAATGISSRAPAAAAAAAQQQHHMHSPHWLCRHHVP